MPRCSCAGSCSCTLSAAANSGLTVTGRGSSTDPYLVSVAPLTFNRSLPASAPLDLSAITPGAVIDLTLDGDATSITLPTAGHGFDVFIREGAAAHTVTWPPEIKWPGGIAPTLTTTPGHGDWISLRRVGADWIGAVVGADIG